MTNLEAVKILRNGVLNGKDDTPENNEAIELAISALENIDRITAERDKAIAERDALMKDLEKVPLCHSCKYDLSGNGGVCFECAINAGSKWEWRGV